MNAKHFLQQKCITVIKKNIHLLLYMCKLQGTLYGIIEFLIFVLP